VKGYFEEESLKKRSDTNLIRLVLPFLKPYYRLIIISVVFITLITSLNLLVPFITMYSIDNYIIPKEKKTLTIKPDNNNVKTTYISISKIDKEIEGIIKKNKDLFIFNGKKNKNILSKPQKIRFKRYKNSQKKRSLWS
jgi:ABC-type multidrug transport system fused ATPase/permease subunit